MNDDNDLNIQRRNLMIINSIILLLAITEQKVDSFTIIGITFSLENKIESFNNILLFVWGYLNLRYLSTFLYSLLDINNNVFIPQDYFHKIFDELEDKRNKSNEEKSIFLVTFLVNIIDGLLKMFISVINLLLSKNLYDFIVPVVFTLINIYIYFENALIILIISFTILIVLNSKVSERKQKLYSKYKKDKKY